MFIISSCTMSSEQLVKVNGKIAIENSNGLSASLFFPDTRRTIALRYDKREAHGGLHWASTTNDFVGIQQFISETGRISRGNVVLFNLKGEIIDTVYTAKEDELTGNAYLSNKDSRLLFTLSIDHFDPANPLDQLNRPTSIVVMDFKSKEIIKKIDNVGSTSKIDFNESPWFADESRFIYDIRGDRKMTIEGESIAQDENEPGIYLYNLATNEHSLIIKDGYYGVVSPTADLVAYISDKRQIWLYDLASGKRQLVYNADKNEKVMHIHWAPSGEYIYLTNYNKFAFDIFYNGSKLIRVSDGQEASFVSDAGPGFGSYTWR